MTSEVGRGSTFQVFLPKSEAPARTELVQAQPPAPNGGREGVLVVDDEPMVRHLARSVLERKGYRVLTAVDGLEALRIYGAQAPVIDLVLLDYTMPGMTGLQVFHKLREINPAVRVIFSSGHTMDSDSEVLLAAGGRAFVAKPYRVDDLVRRVRQVLDEAEPAGQEALRN
jgi:CheY-like chemotaxis protein